MFDSNSPDCDINLSIHLNDIDLSSYPGTLTQLSGNSIELDGNWTQDSGSFLGGDSTIRIEGNLSVSGGSFQSTSDRLSVIDSNVSLAAGTFSHNNGECYLYHPDNDRTIDVNGESFYDLIFRIVDYVSYVTLQSDIDVNNNLTLKGGDDNRSGLRGDYNITVQGNVYYDSSDGKFGSVSRQTTIVLNGAGDQELSASGGWSYSPFLKIDKPSGDVAINGDGIRVEIENDDKDAIHWASGPSVSGDGSLGVHFSDNVRTYVKFDVTPSGEINELLLTGYYSSRIDITGTIPAHDVRIESLHLFNHRAMGGTVEFSGDFISNTSNFLSSSTTAFKAVGSGVQNLTGFAGVIPFSLEVDKPGGEVLLSMDYTIHNNMTIISGDFNQTHKINLNGDYTQSGGNFIGGSEDFEIKGDFSLSGGVFTSTSGKLNFVGTSSQNINMSSSATFNHNYGELINYCNENDQSLIASAGDLYNWQAYNNGNSKITSIGSDVVVRGDFVYKAGRYNNSEFNGSHDIYLHGNLISDRDNVGSFCSSNKPEPRIVLVGSGDQELENRDGFNRIPRVRVDKPSGNVVIIGTIRFADSWIWVSGDGISGNGTLRWYCFGGGDHGEMTPGPYKYNKIYIEHEGNSNFTINGTLRVIEKFTDETRSTSGGYLYGGPVEIEGDLDITSQINGGTCNFVINGSGDQDLKGSSSGFPGDTLEINKPGGGTVYLKSNLNLNTTSHDLIITCGSLETMGFNITGDNIENNSGPFIISDSTITCDSLTNKPRRGVIVISSPDAVFNITSFINNSFVRTDYPGRLPSSFVNNRVVSPSWKHGFQTVPLSETLVKIHNKITPHAFTYKANS